MFDAGFKIHVTIGDYWKDYGISYKPYIKNVHVSEQIETKDGKKVAVIKLTPIVDKNLFHKVEDYQEKFTYEFNYRLHTFLPSDVNTYYIQCGEFTKTISVRQDK